MTQPLDASKSGTVPATGTLTLTFSPKNDGGFGIARWTVKQITAEMANAPGGARLSIRKGGVLVAPAFSARRAAVGGDPPVPIRPGEEITVEWTGATPGDTGTAYILYEKVGLRDA